MATKIICRQHYYISSWFEYVNASNESKLKVDDIFKQRNRENENQFTSGEINSFRKQRTLEQQI